MPTVPWYNEITIFYTSRWYDASKTWKEGSAPPRTILERKGLSNNGVFEGAPCTYVLTYHCSKLTLVPVLSKLLLSSSSETDSNSGAKVLNCSRKYVTFVLVAFHRTIVSRFSECSGAESKDTYGT